jgi:ribosome-associated protein
MATANSLDAKIVDKEAILTMDGLEFAKICAFLAAEKKAEDLKILEVGGLTSYADYFVISSAPSERQTQAIARNVIDELRDRGRRPIGLEGLDQGAWVLADYGDVVVHTFYDEAREYYDLDGFWVDAKSVDWDEDEAKKSFDALPKKHDKS